MLILLVVASLTTFSQKGIKNDTTQICFDVETAKQIAKDLISGDSAKEILKFTEQQLSETEKKVFVKDSIITKLNESVSNYEVIVNDQKNKYELADKENRKLNIQIKKMKFITKLKSYVGGGLLGIAALIIILK